MPADVLMFELFTPLSQHLSAPMSSISPALVKRKQLFYVSDLWQLYHPNAYLYQLK